MKKKLCMDYIILKIMSFIGMVAYIPIRFWVNGDPDMEGMAAVFFMVCFIGGCVPKKYFDEEESQEKVYKKGNTAKKKNAA